MPTVVLTKSEIRRLTKAIGTGEAQLPRAKADALLARRYLTSKLPPDQLEATRAAIVAELDRIYGATS